MPASASPFTPFGHLPWLAKANGWALMGLVGVLSALLWPAWTHNPDLSHGLFMPVIFGFLLYDSRSQRPARFLNSAAAVAIGASVLAVLGLGLLVVAGLYAAVLDWSHALVEFALAGSLSLLLGAALLGFADARVRWLPFNWTSLVAIGLWPLSAPIPPGTYSRVTAALQLWVSTNVLHTLHLLGIAAFRTGNIIELAHASVGVEEACSGVRSLVSCIFAGVFFSASLVTRPGGRFVIIAIAPCLALLMNFLRSLTLTLLVNRGIDIRGAWHDVTGYAVLGVTAILLGGIAVLLEHRRVGARPPSAVPHPIARLAPFAPQRLLGVALALAVAIAGLFLIETRPSPRRDTPTPNLEAILPSSAPGWEVRTTGNLYQFKDILQTDILAQRVYRQAGDAAGTQVVLYLAYWRPDQAPVSLVASHTPDACWPGSGWVMQPASDIQETLTIGGRPLATAESRYFINVGYPQHVWFWHLFDGRPIPYQNPYSLRELLSTAWKYGFRHGGDQVFVRVSSNRPWAEIANEPFLRDFFAGLRPLGL